MSTSLPSTDSASSEGTLFTFLFNSIFGSQLGLQFGLGESATNPASPASSRYISTGNHTGGKIERGESHEGFSTELYSEYFKSEDWGNANGESLLQLKSSSQEIDVPPSPSSGGYDFYVDITPDSSAFETQAKQGSSEGKIKESTHQWFNT